MGNKTGISKWTSDGIKGITALKMDLLFVQLAHMVRTTISSRITCHLILCFIPAGTYIILGLLFCRGQHTVYTAAPFNTSDLFLISFSCKLASVQSCRTAKIVSKKVLK